MNQRTLPRSMFEILQPAPPDPILGLTEAFQRDPNPDKINLSVGVFRDAQGVTPILSCVKQAEQRLLRDEASKIYLGIDGLPEFNAQVRRLVLGDAAAGATSGAALQTPGGTGALRVVADFLSARFPAARVWCSRPTWENHGNIFRRAGLAVQEYAYLNEQRTGLDFEAMTQSLRQANTGDIVLLHACCHNPTGIDPSPEQWRQLAEQLREQELLPLIDLAYQGFGDGLDQDAVAIRTLLEHQPQGDLLACISFSKNFSLYGERVGVVLVNAKDATSAQSAVSHLKASIRANYSSPPKHGAAIVAEVLSSPDLESLWRSELAQMRERIHGMRQLFVEQMRVAGSSRDHSFLLDQRGMFSFSGLNPLQVDRLRSEHAIYIVGSGRINVAGITPGNASRLCQAIVEVESSSG